MPTAAAPDRSCDFCGLTLFVADDSDVHEMLLTRCLSIAGGTTQILRNVVAERVFGLPRG